MVYGDFKDLPRRTAPDKILCDEIFDIAKNLKYDGYKRGLASVVCNFFDKKSARGAIRSDIMSNLQLAEALHKPVIRKFERWKVYSSFRDNIWGVDLAGMQLINKYNEGILFLLCVIDIYSKHVGIVHLKDKKCIAITKVFHQNLDESNCKQKKVQVSKGREFYNRLIKSLLQESNRHLFNTQLREICCCWTIC